MTSTAGKTTRATGSIFAGLFLVTLATLLLEMLLTRIFSVTMWYHFAFVAVSIALFGMTLGANIVYLRPGWFPQTRLSSVLSVQAALFAISTPLAMLTHLSIPFHVDSNFVSIFSVFLTYAVISVPFVFSGIIVALVLTRYSAQVNALYAADLAGAAMGALIFVRLLDFIDGLSAIFVVATAAAAGAVCFMLGSTERKSRRTVIWTAVCMSAFLLISGAQYRRGQPIMRIVWAKDALDKPHSLDIWNAFSRITVDPMWWYPFGWGLSTKNPHTNLVDQLYLVIDSTAGTPITRFDDHNYEKLQYLKYDIVNLAHHIRGGTDVAVLGVGGGRDILSALLFDQRSVLALEINRKIIEVLTSWRGDYAGHLEKDPRVRLVNDEARSYLARSKDQFGIIQVSLIDTWAATSAGAFVLTENSLYTTDAWKIFLKRLRPDGILTFSRWYFPSRPAEAYRLMALAVQSLRDNGVADPGKHIMFARMLRPHEGEEGPDGVGTIMVSPTPFTAADETKAQEVCARMGFDLIFTPTKSTDEWFTRITSTNDLESVSRSYPLRIDPPTDNAPFFFQQLRLRDIFRTDTEQGYMTNNIRAVGVLGILLLAVIILTTLCIIVPLASSGRTPDLSVSWPLLLYFGAIGLAFMFVEISQMQRLIVFLGHPIYGLAVVLFSLLLFTGAGSWATELYLRRTNFLPGPLIALVLVLCAADPATRFVISELQSAELSTRILSAVAILFPMGLFLGAAFPLGMRLASTSSSELSPWLWGVNGATSVCGSVLSACIALSFGISASYWTGVLCYVIALAAFMVMRTTVRKSEVRAEVAV